MASFLRRLVPARNFNACMHLNRAMSSAQTDKKELVVVEQIGNVMTIGINRPEVRNCVNPATATQLFDAFNHFEETEDAYVAVFHGKGGCFCSGYDLKSLSSKEGLDQFCQPKDGIKAPMGASRMMFSKPVIAAVDGYAVAGGLEMALLCDLRVVEENAIMGVFCRRWGVPLLDGGTVRLPGLIGLSRAMDLVLTGRPVTAKEALDMGLANRVVPTGTALGQAIQLANTIAQFPQECMRKDRANCYYTTFEAKSRMDAFQNEFVEGIKVVLSESVPGATKFAKGSGRHGSFEDFKPKL